MRMKDDKVGNNNGNKKKGEGRKKRARNYKSKSISKKSPKLLAMITSN